MARGETVSQRVAAVITSLAFAAVTGGLALYREVGALKENVAELQRDMTKRDDRERRSSDLLARIEERIVRCEE